MDQTTDDRECRLCFEGGGDLIAPCNCRGTSQWVHRSCLNRWRSMNHNPIAFTHCTECQFEYKLERVARTQSEMQRRFQLRVARDSTVVFIVIQSVIFLAAFLVRLCDPQERMVKIVGLRQLPGQDMSHGLLNALEHHKTTYYICGLLLCLFLVGVVGTLVAAYYWCCRETNENSTASGSGFMDYYFRPNPFRGQPRRSPRSHTHERLGDMRERRQDRCMENCCDGTYYGPNNCNCCCCCEVCEDFGVGGSAMDCSCPQCASISGEAPGLLFVLFFICVFIGIIVAVVSITVVIQRLIQRHFALIQRGALADEWHVVDLAVEGGGTNGHSIELMETGGADYGAPGEVMDRSVGTTVENEKSDFSGSSHRGDSFPIPSAPPLSELSQDLIDLPAVSPGLFS